MTVQNQEDLDNYIRNCCGDPNCTLEHDMEVMSDCHPQAPVLVNYRLHSGVLLIRCSVCKKLIAMIGVASRELAFAV